MKRTLVACSLLTTLWMFAACKKTTLAPGYAIGGTVSGLQGAVFLQNGNEVTGIRDATSFTFLQNVASGSPYNVSVYQQPDYQNCTVSNASGTVGSADISSIVVNCAASASTKTFTTAMPFNYVIGPDDFFTYDDPTLDGPYGNSAVVDGKFYVSCTQACSIAVFNTPPTANGASPDYVLGLDALNAASSQNCPPPDANTFSSPQTISSNAGKMAIADYTWNRILIYNSPPSSSSTPADNVVGQPNFTTVDSGCSASSLSGASSVMVTPMGRMIVTDHNNNRILIWNQVPTSDGAPADLVLGQPDLMTCATNPPSSTTLNGPVGIWSDDTKLVVADFGFFRVLGWNTFPTSNAAPASWVLGAPDFNTVLDPYLIGSSSVGAPYAILSDGEKLFVGSYGYTDRVNVYNTWPTVNNAAADAVLGQQSFQDEGFSVFAPTGLAFIGDNLAVSDGYENRLVVFKPY